MAVVNLVLNPFMSPAGTSPVTKLPWACNRQQTANNNTARRRFTYAACLVLVQHRYNSSMVIPSSLANFAATGKLGSFLPLKI